MNATWQTDDGSVKLFLGDCLTLLPTLPDKSIDLTVCDPPYSSGGFTRGDRTGDPTEKYVQTGTEIIRDSFSGDNRDGRSWCYWSALWMSEAYRVTVPSGRLLMFCDWRQLPLASDAIQAGGFVWRGIIAWDKGPSARAAQGLLSAPGRVSGLGNLWRFRSRCSQRPLSRLLPGSDPA